MEKVTVYKNKGETFRCHFKIEGASMKDTVVRLCLEFSENPNYFFYGKLEDSGECVIEIPRLKNLDEKSGRLTVEAIADSVYFKVYEADVEFRNSVEVSMESPSVKKSSPASVRMEEFSQDEKARRPAPAPATDDGWKPVTIKPPQYGRPPADKAVKTGSFRTFGEYAQKARS